MRVVRIKRVVMTPPLDETHGTTTQARKPPVSHAQLEAWWKRYVQAQTSPHPPGRVANLAAAQSAFAGNHVTMRRVTSLRRNRALTPESWRQPGRRASI